MFLSNDHHKQKMMHANQKHRSSSLVKVFGNGNSSRSLLSHFSLICLPISRWNKSILFMCLHCHWPIMHFILKNYIQQYLQLYFIEDTFWLVLWQLMINLDQMKTGEKIIHLLTTFSFFSTWQFTKFCSICQYIEIYTRTEIVFKYKLKK